MYIVYNAYIYIQMSFKHLPAGCYGCQRPMVMQTDTPVSYASVWLQRDNKFVYGVKSQTSKPIIIARSVTIAMNMIRKDFFHNVQVYICT